MQICSLLWYTGKAGREQERWNCWERFLNGLCVQGPVVDHNKESYCFGSHRMKHKAIYESKCAYDKRWSNLWNIVLYLEFSPVHSLSSVTFFYFLLELGSTQNICFCWCLWMSLSVFSFPLQQWFGNAEGTFLEQKGLKKARTFL